MLRQRIDNLRAGATDHIPQLVRESRETTAECGWRQLVEMDWNNPPCALDEELHHESRGGEGAFGGGQNPGGDQGHGDEGCEDNGAAAADELGEVPEDGAADAGTDLHDDGGAGGAGVVEAFAGYHECCVAVLGGVGVEVEPDPGVVVSGGVGKMVLGGRGTYMRKMQ